ncbi:hypothetical protein H2203_001347 [Taxawa tesnikishii (nom. ined.)]|nr:hypothetical protein H2203_001347 [Dothideales sp. JES 119]
MPPKRARTAAAKSATTAAPATRAAQRTTRRAAARKDAEAERDETVSESVVKNPTRRGARRVAQREEETVTASEDAQDAGAGAEEAEAGEEVQAEAPKARNARTRGRPRKTVVRNAEDRKATEALKQRMLQEDEAKKAGEDEVVKDTQPEREGGDEDDMVPESQPVNTTEQEEPPRLPTPPPPATVARPRPQSALKVQSTPGADKSVLALANFRRRARQPSILQMVQRADEGGEDETENTTAMTLEGSDEEEDSFLPEHEGTPMIASRQAAVPGTDPQKGADTSTVSVNPEPGPTVGEGEEEDELYRITPPPPGNPRKRKSDVLEGGSEIQVLRSSPSRPRSRSRSSSPGLPTHANDPDNTVPATAPETSPSDDEESSLSPGSGHQPPAPGSTMAEPLSSTTARNAASKKQQKPLDTATLRSLLPKRRAPQRGLAGRRSSFDVPTSSDADAARDGDEDELAPRRRGAGRKKRRGGGAATTGTTLKKLAGRKGAPRAKGAAGAKAKDARTSNVTRTYGRASDVANASNKENDGDESSELSELESDTGDTSVETVAPKKTGGAVGASEELREAKEKFADVDKWEMEFESCSFTQGSSPWR